MRGYSERRGSSDTSLVQTYGTSSLRQKTVAKFKDKYVPRKLSEDQINDIVEFSIPKIPAVLDVISEDNNRQIKEFIRCY